MGNLMERFVQYVKDQTEGLDGYFPRRAMRCRFEHVMYLTALLSVEFRSLQASRRLQAISDSSTDPNHERTRKIRPNVTEPNHLR